MKKLILIFAVLGLINSSISSATFTLKYGTTNLSENVYVYQNGKQVASGSTSSTTGSLSITLPTGTYSYKTATNFTGDITATSTVVLDHKKATFIIKDNAGNPISSESINIYEDGIQVDNGYTNSSGIAEFYLRPSGKYAYKTSFNQSAISLLNDASVTLTKNNVSVIAKYQNYPIEDNFMLYPYGDTQIAIAYDNSSATNGEINFNVTTGSYWLKNKLSVYTKLNITSINQQFYLDYKKVRFISNVNVPNILENVSVSHGNYSTDTKITDGKGYADFYLLPGTYTYSHLGMSEKFTVKNDTTVNLNTTKPGLYIFELNLTNNNSAFSNQNYYIKQDGNYVNTSFKTNNQGVATTYLPNGNYSLYNVITQEETPFTISNQNKTLNLQLPNEITLNVTIDGQAVTAGGVIIYNEQKTAVQGVPISNGTGKVRLPSGSNYYAQLNVSNVVSMQSKVTISSNSVNLDFISLQIKSTGKGIAFPYQTDENNLVYYLKQSSIRLAAVPMKGWSCTKWVINSTNINDDLVDYSLNGATIATAVFEQNGSNSISQVKSSANNLSIYPNPAETQINFSENLSGKAIIYNTEGKVIKQTYVYGNSINISDLSSGVYIVAIETENDSYKGNFMKK